MSQHPNEAVAKALLSNQLVNGGQVSLEQTRTFIVEMRKGNKLLSAVRRGEMSTRKQRINKMNFGTPALQRAEEYTASNRQTKVNTSYVEIEAFKMRLQKDIPSETFLDNIEGDALDATIMGALTTRAGVDLEMLGFQGDVAKWNADGSDLGELLATTNGWGKLAMDKCPYIDAKGANVSVEMLGAARRKLAPSFASDPALQFLISDIVYMDLWDSLRVRMGGVGDQTLVAGALPNLIGKQIVSAPHIPNNLDLTLTEATPALVISKKIGPYTFKGSGSGQNNVIRINLNSGGNVDITIPEGTRSTSEIANLINAAHAAFAGLAFEDSEGRLNLKTAQTGASATIQIVTIANNAYTELGLTVGTTTGGASGSSNTLAEGSYILLTNPQNLIYGVVNSQNDLRLYNRYDEDLDAVKIRGYMWAGFQIENPDACVIIKNVRPKPLATF